jgi:energy-coupling factor transporter ATP-binding protein EcfA2
MGSSISIHSIMGKKYPTYDFTPELISIIGDAEKNFKMIVWGQSGNGKTTFVANLCKILTAYGKVYYNSVEQGEGKSIQDMARLCKLDQCEKGSFVIGDRDTFDEMVIKLETNRCRFAVIDSAQYMDLSIVQYKFLIQKFKRKSFIIISWEKGSEPKGEAAQAMRYMVDIKCRVHKGIAYVDSRFGATEPHHIPGLYEKFHKAQAELKKSGDQLNLDTL